MKLARIASRLSRQAPTVRKGIVSGRLSVPTHIPRPSYVDNPSAITDYPDEFFEIKSPSEIEGMRAVGLLAKNILRLAGSLVHVGVTTDHIDSVVHHAIVKAGAYPSPLGYMGFPKSLCTSVNEVICHGIPDSRPLQDGDIVKLDITVYLNGFHGDTAATFVAGQATPETLKLVDAAKDVMHAGIQAVAPGRPASTVGQHTYDRAQHYGYELARHIQGHGIGRDFHTPPWIDPLPNECETILQPGMTFTVEPSVLQGDYAYEKWADKWTMVTRDCKWASNFEHTVLVTSEGVEILT
eukprot:TRINITY_DN3812_c0_g1_i4.p1 TRINITY_DN3812_c0_g1~~TRINITY_DN3812_c0_g1_i4.p1  ORF type:complete len:296 (-),score=57.92 TRINITY_DN3812_c0_g1_i4:68-955(-)